jgi:hypothetical protein
VLARPFLLTDACVLIDFVAVDESLLALTARHVGELYVASPVLAEVKRLDLTKAESLGIKVVHPELDMAMAAAEKRGRLSMQDQLCVTALEQLRPSPELHHEDSKAATLLQLGCTRSCDRSSSRCSQNCRDMGSCPSSCLSTPESVGV